MERQPSIKGTLFEVVVADVEALVPAGRVTQEALEARLEPEDLAFFGRKLAPALWYPIESYARLLETLRDVEGGADPERYLRRRGAEAAERMIQSGLYSQLDATVETWGERVGKIMVTLGRVCFNFGSWDAQDRDGILTVEARESEALPEVSRTVIAGFIEVITRRALKARVGVVTERPSPGCVRWLARHV